MFTNILIIAGIIGIGVVIYLLIKQQGKQSTNNSDVLAEKERKIEEFQKQLKSEEKEKNTFAGKNRELWAQQQKLDAELKFVTKERDSLQNKVIKFEASKERMEQDFKNKIEKLDARGVQLEKEQQRVIREDEEKIQKEKEERDRMWNDHERAVLSLLAELCSKEESKFEYYDNNSLPKGFDGSFKPDFMIDFIGQYIIFDAKTTKSDDLKTYIRDAVKKTAQKMKGKKDIYHTVFFVVPTQAIPSLKQTTFYEQSITFHIVNPEALATILATLKRMSDYEFTEKFDPEERENIVSVLSSLSNHIQVRSAYDVLLAREGIRTIDNIKSLGIDMQKEVQSKLDKSKPFIPAKSEILKLAEDGTYIAKEVDELTNPKAKINKKLLEEIPMEIQ